MMHKDNMLYARFVDNQLAKIFNSDEIPEDFVEIFSDTGTCSIPVELVYEDITHGEFQYRLEHPVDEVKDNKFIRTFKVTTVDIDSIRTKRVKQIKDAAADDITARYPLWKQLNIIREGGAALEEMSNYIDDIRSTYDLHEKAFLALETAEEMIEFNF
jgi:hypothetical protein